MSNIAEKLRSTTEEMALRASVGMGLWDRHSNSCLDAAEEIDRLNAENARLREERPQIDYVIDSHGVTHRSFTLVYKTRAAIAKKEEKS